MLKPGRAPKIAGPWALAPPPSPLGCPDVDDDDSVDISDSGEWEL